jgi:fermentation-respiration switch protein FrsA (DUF1100 family)
MCITSNTSFFVELYSMMAGTNSRTWGVSPWRAGMWALLSGAVLASSACVFVAGSSPSVVAAPPAILHAENVTFASASGGPLHAWLARGESGAGAVLLLHGVGENRASMRGRMLFLHGAGFTVLAPDFQAHGESPGEHVTYGAREALDAAAAIGYLRDVAPGERVGVIGVSMGGAATLLGTGPLAADAFVLESVYPTFRQAVSNRLGSWFGPIGGAARLFTAAAIRLIRSATGIAEADLQPIARIGRIRGPLLLIAGTADRYTPLAEAESLFARAPEPKTFWPVSGADHVDLHAYDPREYERRVGGFLSRNLRIVHAR